MANYISKFVQLTDYILLEYRYTDLINPEKFNHNFTRVVNGHTAEIQLLNADSAEPTTTNVRERSVTKISASKYVDLDKDQVPDWLTYDTQLASTTVTAVNCPYDTVVFHLLAGYNFEDLDGVILEVKAPERSGKKLTLAALAFLKDSDYFEYNAKPIFLGDRLYDRFFFVKVPSIKLNNEIYYSLEGNPTQPLTFVAKVTSNNQGFLRANPIEISATEIKSTTTNIIGSATYKTYNIGTTKKVPINQADEYSNLSAVIKPSSDGDYFEFFASWDGGFIEDFILNANGLPGNNWIVIHELRVIEQVGSSFKQTGLFQIIQDSAYDQPNLFRPVILNAAHAISFSIEYSMRLYNKADSSQVIRTASYTDYNPKMWGRQIQKIKLLNEPEPHRIYNKVVSGPVMSQSAFLNTSQDVVPFTTKTIPAFFDRTTVTVAQDSVFLDANGHLKSEKTSSTETIYGQGDANIIITPFDNFFKFTIMRTDAKNSSVPTPIDLGSNARYYMVFINDNGKKIKFQNENDALIGNPSRGDLVFKIPGGEAENILKFANKEFWIISRFDDGSETSIYQGMFNKPSDRSKVKDADDKIKSAQHIKIQESIKSIENKANLVLNAAQIGSVKNAGLATPVISAANEGTPVTTSGIKVPPNIKKETQNELLVQVPGLGQSVVSTQSSVVASIKPASSSIKKK